MTILDEIVAHKRAEVARKKERARKFELNGLHPTRDFEQSLKADGISLIAEVKRCSPSKGAIRKNADPGHLARIYEKNGAAAISVLTDERFFCGKDEFVNMVKVKTKLPVLRKEFILDEYQIYESRMLGADAILLIASILNRTQLSSFLTLAHELDLACLVEAHSETDVEKALRAGARIIGINNRDLETLKVDITTSLRLRKRIPPGIVTVGESGIGTREDMKKMEKAGFEAVLVGESVMSAPDIALKIKELLGE